ncbi:MAG: sensor histidine kinase [Deltaproteobacteria bacterium]|nr:sensor histidine kinase [Deltaproteobacteria bacterium]
MESQPNTDEIQFPPRWVDGLLFEQTILQFANPHRTNNSAVRFHFPTGCKIMIDAGVRLLSFANQLHHVGKTVVLDFEEGELGTLGYLDRMGFFDLLHSEVFVRPHRPVVSGADLYRGGSQNLMEFASISPDHRDRGLPNRLTEVLSEAVKHRSDMQALELAAYTVFGELIDNIYEHSATELEGYAVLQVYQNGGRVKVSVSDSGKGIIETLRPSLNSEYRNRVALSDPELVVEAFRTGLSRHGNIRGCGLKTSADQAIRFRADLDVRLPNCFVRLIPSADGYQSHKAHIYQNLPLIWGTHISFDFDLDNEV